MRFSDFLLVLALGSTALACRSEIPDFARMPNPTAASEPDPEGRVELRRDVDPVSGRTTNERAVLVVPGRGAMRHGVERVWYRSGALHWEREFRFGKPTGVWRSWFENGQPRTECFYLGPDMERTMSFWREDGKLAAQGPACDGARQGKWRFWWSNGQLAEEGEYRGGSKEGPWLGWSEDGERAYERVYEKNVRVSQREIDSAGVIGAATRTLPGAQ